MATSTKPRKRRSSCGGTSRKKTRKRGSFILKVRPEKKKGRKK